MRLHHHLFLLLAWLGIAACSAPAAPDGPLTGSAIGGPFSLSDGDGKTVSDRDFPGKWQLIYFGYTFCPDVCPTDAARNADAVDLLARDGIAVKQVFITIDPARDTPEAMRDFTDNIAPGLIGLTGTEAQVKAASDAWRTFFAVSNPDDEYYLMDHTTLTYLMQPAADGTPARLCRGRPAA